MTRPIEKVSIDAVAPNTRRGGDLRVLLSPRTVGATSGFMGAGLAAARRAHHRALPPVLRGVPLPGARAPRRRARRRAGDHPQPPATRSWCRSVDPAPAGQRRRRGGAHGLPPRPARPAAELGHVDTEAADRDRRRAAGRGWWSAVRRVVITGLGVVAPGRDRHRRRSGTCSPRAAPRPARITLFDPRGSARRSPPRSTSTRPPQGLTPAGDPPDGPGRPVRAWSPPGRRSPTAGSTSTAGRPDRIGGDPRQRGRRHHRPGAGVRRGQRRRPATGWSTTGYAVPHLYDYFVPSSLAAEVAWAVGAEGPVAVVSTGCTSGLDAVGHAVRADRGGQRRRDDRRRDRRADLADHRGLLRRDQGDHAAATTTPSTPRGRSTRTRNGFVLGEGAAVLVLEETGTPAARGAHDLRRDRRLRHPRQRLPHDRAASPDGREMAEAIRAALRPRPGSTRTDDRLRQRARLGHQAERPARDRRVQAQPRRARLQDAVSSIKSMVGHSLGAIGSIEIAACALAIEHDVVPPTANLHDPDPECDLDYVPLTAREQPRRRGAHRRQRVRRVPERDGARAGGGR